MTVIKRFAQDGNALDDCVDQLVEVLAQLLEEKQDSVVKAADDYAIADLHSGSDRVIHVVGARPRNRPRPRSLEQCQ